MKCTKIQDLLSAYIDGMCSDEEKKEIENHLEHCEECRNEYNILKSIISDINNIEDVEAPESLHEDIMNKISNMPQIKTYRYKKIIPSSIAAGFVLIVILSVIGFGNLQNWFLTNYNDSSYEESEATKVEEQSIDENEVNVQYDMVESYDLMDENSLDKNTTQDIESGSKNKLISNSIMMDAEKNEIIDDKELTCKQNTDNRYALSNEESNTDYKMYDGKNSESVDSIENFSIYNKEENSADKKIKTQSNNIHSNSKLYIIISLIILSIIDIIILIKTKK